MREMINLEVFQLIVNIMSLLASIATVMMFLKIYWDLNAKLKIKGELPFLKCEHYNIYAFNRKVFDAEIISISFSKGNPSGSNGHIFGTINNLDYPEFINSKNNYFIIPKGDSIIISIPLETIIKQYDANIGEAFGKPYDNIFICIRDNCGRRYNINTNGNIDFWRKIHVYNKKAEIEGNKKADENGR